jgi:hypothetical protein
MSADVRIHGEYVLKSMLPTLGKGILPDQPKNAAADKKIRPHALCSIKA